VDIGQPKPSLPPLNDLLTWSIAPNQFHLYVLCRPNRYILCQAILKDPQGSWVREGDRLWSIPLMGRSLHHLTWNFGRGNTPQGIYRVEGTIPQPDTEFFRAYGLFPLVNLFVPWESGVNQFLAGRQGYGFSSLTDYQSLLPPQWRSYYPIHQSYWAGKGEGVYSASMVVGSPPPFSRIIKWRTPVVFGIQPLVVSLLWSYMMKVVGYNGLICLPCYRNYHQWEEASLQDI
jgi:hypothetical protein